MTSLPCPLLDELQTAKMEELDEQLREYIEEWRKQRTKEQDELDRLKEKQVRRSMKTSTAQAVEGPRQNDGDTKVMIGNLSAGL